MDRPVVTAPIAATGLIAGYAVAASTGSRPLGGAVLVGFALPCVGIWLGRDGTRRALQLTGVGLSAFALSHVLALGIGAWPAVLACAAATAGACWRLSDAEARSRARLGLGPRARAGARG
jgi:hypothetical protein